MKRAAILGRLALTATCVALLGAAIGQAADTPLPEPAMQTIDLARIPRDSLTATRERPLFRPTRRAAEPPIVGAAPATAAEPSESPQLTLLGVIREGATRMSAVVLDETDHTSHTLRLGESRRGWLVGSIGAKSVDLTKGQRAATLTFPTTSEPDLHGIQE